MKPIKLTKPKKIVAGCVVLKFENDDVHILLVTEDGIEWGIPKGGIEPGEDHEAAAIRETFEETSIVVKTIGFLGVEGRLSAWFALPLDKEQKPIPQPNEIIGAKYHSVKSLPSIEGRQMPIIERALERLRAASEL